MDELQQTLSNLHRELGGARNLGPEERAMLETALGDIQRALQQGAAEAGRGDALEDVAVRLEAGHPGLAGAVRALIDALAKAGI